MAVMDYIDRDLSSNDTKEIMYKKVMDFIIESEDNQYSKSISKKTKIDKLGDVKEEIIGELCIKIDKVYVVKEESTGKLCT